MKNRKGLMVSGVLAVLVLLSLGVLAVTAATVPITQEQQEPDNRPAGEVYKNLKMEMFKGMTVARVDRVMQMMNKVLGVKCTHCHKKNNWAKDDLNKKQKHAREMMTAKMFPMVIAIGRDHFRGKEGPTCWTCHRGSTKPESSPAGGWKPRPQPQSFY